MVSSLLQRRGRGFVLIVFVYICEEFVGRYYSEKTELSLCNSPIIS